MTLFKYIPLNGTGGQDGKGREMRPWIWMLA